MTTTEQILTILIMSIATILTRSLPFLLFSKKEKVPTYIHYLGDVLPAALFGFLIIYCLKDVSLGNHQEIIFTAIAIAVTVGVHKWKKQMLLSIASGTICYMLLVQLL